MDHDYDVAVVGGSFAGLSAALQLSLGRRRVVVIDAGLARNRFTGVTHGMLGHDGRSPAEIRRLGREQLLAYPTSSMVEDTVASASGANDDFRLALSGGGEITARRIILAVGVTDTLPDIDGLVAGWGTSVIHCPYCHGYEYRDQRLGVLASMPMSVHQATLVRDWSDNVTLFANGVDLSDDDRAALDRRGVRIVEPPVASVAHRDGHLEAVCLADGSSVPLDALFVAPKTAPTGTLHVDLGCRVADGPMGPYIEVDDRRATSVPGVCAAGDAARVMAAAALAASDGTMAGSMAHMSLLPT